MSNAPKPVPEGKFTDPNNNLTVEGRELLLSLVRAVRDLQARVKALEE